MLKLVWSKFGYRHEVLPAEINGTKLMLWASVCVFVNVCYGLGYLYRVDVGSVFNVSEVHTASIFRVEMYVSVEGRVGDGVLSGRIGTLYRIFFLPKVPFKDNRVECLY
jgi:hypothetical protein